MIASVDHERIVGQVVGMHCVQHLADQAVHAMNERPVRSAGANDLVLWYLGNSL